MSGAAGSDRTMHGSGLHRTFAFCVYALSLLQILHLWPAAADVPLARPLAAAIVLAALMGAVWLARGTIGPAAEAQDDATAEPVPSPLASAAAWCAVLAALAWSMTLWIRSWTLAWHRPVYDWDGLYYHVPAMHGWAMSARIRWIPGMDDLPFVNGYPMAVEALGFLVQRLTGTSRLVDAGNLFFWPLAAGALAVLAGALGARGPWRWAPAGLLATVPGWVILSTTCYVDPAFAACVMAALAAGMLYVSSPAPRAHRDALLFGAALGLAIGTKGQGAPFAVLLLCTALAVRGWITRGSGAARGPALLLSALIAAGAAFATGGYWALRDLVMSGNPIFPIQLSLGPKLLAAGYDTRALLEGNMPGWLAAWPALLRVPVAWLQTDAPIRGYAATGGLGWIWLIGLACVPIAAALAFRRRAQAPLVGLALCVALLLVVQPAPWWARMTLWLHALSLPCIALVLDRFARAAAPGARFLAPLALLAVLAVGAAEAHGAFEAERANGRLSTAGDTYRSSAETIFPGFERACPEFLAAPRIARGPWSRFGTLMGGVLALPLDARTIEPVHAVEAATLDTLRAHGVTWVIWDEVQAPLPAVLAAAALDTCAYRAAQDQRFVMVRIAETPEALTPPPGDPARP